MQLPIDIKALIDESTNIQTALQTPISVSVYLDETAPADVIAHVRNKFASSLPTVRMTIMYVGPDFAPQERDDIAVLVAGTSPTIGKAAADLRSSGVPVMVVTTLPIVVADLAEKAGYPIPRGDLIFPMPTKDAPDAVSEDAAAMAAASLEAAEASVIAQLPKDAAQTALVQAEKAVLGEGQEVGDDVPIPLNTPAAANLDNRMGRWIVSVCREKRLAYAIAFPFVRRPLANDVVQVTAIQNSAVGLVPFLPGADLPIMTLNQAKMVLQIAAAYGHSMDKERIKELAAVLGTAYVSRALVRSLVKFVPVLGWAFRAGVAYGATTALGYGIIEYFEGGENVTGIANVLEKAIGTGTKLTGALGDKANAIMKMVRKDA